MYNLNLRGVYTMKKIFAFISSQKGEKSNTYLFAKLLLDKLSNEYPKEITYEIIHSQNIELTPCQSCNSCFSNGYCKLDNNDDMSVLKEKMVCCDFLILGSPVYLHNVSSDMKLVIDRISYWAHLFRLAGKKSASISVSSSNGNHFVDLYLTKVLEYLGTQLVANYSITVDDPPLLNNKAFIENEIFKYAESIYNSLMSDEIIISKNQEEYYRYMYYQFIQAKPLLKEKSAEYKYWNTRGMLKHRSLKSYLAYLNRSS